MERLRRESDLQWMSQLAEKHGIDVETVTIFYETMVGRFHNMTKRERTELFFDLYFEGRNN